MRLCSGTTKSLIEDSTFNRIATKLKDAFFLEFRYQPSVGEVDSWIILSVPSARCFSQLVCLIMGFF